MIPYPVVFFTKEDGGYFSVVPDLPGCTVHGETPEEALRRAQTAQELWLEAVRARGWPIPEPLRHPAVSRIA